MTCDSYVPSEADIQWTRNLVQSIQMGGVWGFPAIGVVFKKTGEFELTLVSLESLHTTLANVVHNLERTKKAAKAAGITIKDERTVSRIIAGIGGP